VHIEKVQLISHPSAPNDSSRRSLAVTVRTPNRDSRSSPQPHRAVLTDEHGCRFESYNSWISGTVRSFYFAHVPFGAREFQFELVQQSFGRLQNGLPEHSETKLMSVVITNLCDITPESWSPETLPAKRLLGDVTVELTALDPSAYEGDDEYFLPQHPHHRENGTHPNRGWKPNQFSFWVEEKAAQGWQRISGKFKDRWGNESRSLDAFCKEETIFKFEAVFARDPRSGRFEPSEKVEVSIPKTPGAGESILIDQVQFLGDIPLQIHAISGSGEFYYHNGVPVYGEKQISDPEGNSVFHHQNDPVQSLVVTERLYQAKTAANGTLIPDRSVKVAAKGPHLSFRAPILPREKILLVTEQDRSMADPINAPEVHNAHHTGNGPREWRLIPLQLPPGDKDKKITFTIQKPRVAEFIVQVPARGSAK
jgi:hypothetical protein